MSNLQKNLLAIAVGMLLVFFMLFIWPNSAFSQSTCPPVPVGLLAPTDFVQANWEVIDVKQDTTFGMNWFFLRAKNPTNGQTHALIIMLSGFSWPVMYNYLENGTLIFLTYSTQKGEYIIDPNVDSEDYNIVAKYYEQFLGVRIQPRQGV
jgi:hypothetical protein